MVWQQPWIGMSHIADRIRRHLANPDSQHRKIAKGFVWVSLFVLIGKLAGAVKEMAVAWRYGVSTTVDAYALIFNLVNWPVAVWFSVLTVVLIPLVARMKQENSEGMPLFGAELVGFSLAAGIFLALIGTAITAFLFDALTAGMDRDAMGQAKAMMWSLSGLLPLGFVISAISAWTMALGKHRNTLLEAVPSLVLLVVLLLPIGLVPEPLVWGTLLGASVHTLWLGWPLWRSGELGRPVLAFSSPSWQLFWGGIGIMVVGQSLSTLSGLVDQFFASQLSAGSVSILSYASRLITLILGLGALSISRAILPVFSELSASRSDVELRRLAMYWAKVMFVVGILAALTGWLLAPIGVRLLFERGAFDGTDTQNVAELFRYLSLQIPFYFSSLVLIAYFSAIRKYKFIALSGAVNLLVKVVALYWMTSHYGLAGIAASSVLMYASSLALFIAVRNLVGTKKTEL
jgi:putative peptidoglycan lipid II flippase